MASNFESPAMLELVVLFLDLHCPYRSGSSNAVLKFVRLKIVNFLWREVFHVKNVRSKSRTQRHSRTGCNRVGKAEAKSGEPVSF
jgi:hypothetical protein